MVTRTRPEEFSTMRQLTKFFACTLAITAFAACGGSGDDDQGDDDDAPDASTNPQPDADTTPTPDAAQGLTGLGQTCTGTDCPTNASICAELDMTANGGFCTLSCGTTPNVDDPTMDPPPTGGNEICAAQYSGATGTPFCALYQNDSPSAGTATWYCGILCGDGGGQSFGDCPAGSGLTCQNNLCDD